MFLVQLTAPGSASDRWETRRCPAAPPAGGSVHAGGRRLHEPPAPSSASSYSRTSPQPEQKGKTGGTQTLKQNRMDQRVHLYIVKIVKLKGPLLCPF